MKVVWVSPCLRGRGVTVVCEDAARALSSITNYSVSIACVHEPFGATSLEDGIVVHDLQLPASDIQATCEGFHKWVQSYQPDVLLMNDVPSLEAYWRYVPRHIKLIVVLHDHAYGWKVGLVKNQAYVDGIGFVSEFVRDQVYLDFAEFDGILKTVENGIEISQPNNLRLQTPRIRLVFLGAIDRQKGAYDLPQLLQKFQERGIDFSLTIIGGSDTSLESKLDKLGLSDRVHWMGRLSRNESIEQLAKADILLMLSRGESFGLVTVEAMSVGCVPIAYESGGSPSIVEDKVSGIIVPLCDVEQCANAVNSLYHDRALLGQMSQAAMQRARNRYSCRSMAERYMDFIQEVLANSKVAQRIDFSQFVVPPVNGRRYARYVPAWCRKLISSMISCSPALENYLRRWRGI